MRRNLHETVLQIFERVYIPGDTALFGCLSCGAIVYSQYTHAEWHEEHDA